MVTKDSNAMQVLDP